MKPPEFTPQIEPFLAPIEQLQNRDAQEIIFFDTTLRDGEQSEGSAMTLDEKVWFADKSARAGVQIHEVGFPLSNDDAKNVKAVAEVLNDYPHATTCALTICSKKGIDETYRALENAKRKRIHTFLSTSDIHMRTKLNKEFPQVVSQVEDVISHAREQYPDVEIEFSPEDATRTEIGNLIIITRSAIQAGANVINVPDTVGNASPLYTQWMMEQIVKNTNDLKDDHDFHFSFHGHNDQGLGVANALAAIQGGARQVEACWGDNGERAGNFPLEEVVLALDMQGAKMHPDHTFYHKIQRELVIPTTLAIYKIMGRSVPASKVLVGTKIALHGAGVHTDASVKDGGILGDESTYNVVDPLKYGGKIPEQAVGSRAGGADITKALSLFDIETDKKEVSDILERVTEEAVKSRRTFPSHVLFEYSKARENTSDVAIKIENGGVSARFTVNGKSYEISGIVSGDNSAIQALTQAIGAFCGREIDILDQSETKKASIHEIDAGYARMTHQEPTYISTSSKGAEAIGISRVMVGNGNDTKYNVHLAGQDVTQTNLKAIFIASWPFIREKILREA